MGRISGGDEEHVAGEGKGDQNRRESARQRDSSPASPPEPEETWEAWVMVRPAFELQLDRRVKTVQRLSAALAVCSAVVFVSAIVIESRPPGVGLLWIVGGFAASMALVSGGDLVKYRTAWGRRTGTFTLEDLERRDVPVQVAVRTYLLDSARAIEGQKRTFTLFLSSWVASCLFWSISALLFLG